MIMESNNEDLDQKLIEYEEAALRRFHQYGAVIEYLFDIQSQFDEEGRKTLFELRLMLSDKMIAYISDRLRTKDYLASLQNRNVS